MIRTVNTDDIVKNIKEMCIEANHYLSKDMDKALKDATASEKSELGKKILNQLQENLKIAAEEMIPICQDTGMAVIFLEVGQDVHFEGMAIEDAVNEGVRQGYTEGYLRKSVVGDPIIRENTKDNTPAVIHYSIVPGNKVKITLAPKGFGSEEMITKINQLGIGPGGLGGTTTALAVNINTYATHIAGLPVAVNICCHVNRHVIREV